jgi:hypothetical protein
MSDIWQSLKNKYEHTFVRTNGISVACKTLSIDQVKDLIEHAANQTKRAKNVAAFANVAVDLGKAGEKLETAAEKLNTLAENGSKTLGDVKGACDILEAVSVLNDWTLPNSKVSNQEAAKAFDLLFGGVATYFEKLPPPVNSYARVLAEISRTNFFSQMEDTMNLESPNTLNGQRMRDVLRSIDNNN